MARVTPPLDIIETDEGVEAILDIPGRATARLIDGELRVFLPRLAERRGGQIRIPIRS